MFEKIELEADDVAIVARNTGEIEFLSAAQGDKLTPMQSYMNILFLLSIADEIVAKDVHAVFVKHKPKFEEVMVALSKDLKELEAVA